MNNLKGKIALITGGNRGLGKATALALAAEGIDIVITGRNETKLQAAAQEIEKLGVAAHYVAFDIGNYEEVKKAVQTIKSKVKTIDILVNNAGIASFGSIMDMEVSEWERIIQTNLLGTYYMTKEVLPILLGNKEGDIFNVSSTAGLNGNATISAYSASKFGVIGFSESLMKEVRKENIRVCTLTPSTIASDMAKDLDLTDGNPDKVLQPEDFGQLIATILKLPRRAMLTAASLWSTNP